MLTLSNAEARRIALAVEARKELLVLAARYHGVGTLQDLADYHRLMPTLCKPALAELVEEGRLLPLKADRANRALLVQSAWKEPGVNEREVAAEMLAELRVMATWLMLDRIEVTGRGDLGPSLQLAGVAPARCAPMVYAGAHAGGRR